MMADEVEPRAVFWREDVDGWRVDVVPSPQPAGDTMYRGIVTAPNGRRLHKTVLYRLPGEAEIVAQALVEAERSKGIFRAPWWRRLQAWALRVFFPREAP